MVYRLCYTMTMYKKFLTRMFHYHSQPLTSKFKGMKVKLIPALQDNYMYLLIDKATRQAAAVDPVEPDKVIAAAKEENVRLTTVFTTHHHWDHAGGNKDLISKIDGLQVYAGNDEIDGITVKVGHNFSMKFGSLTVKCLYTPCHTSDHMCYFVKDGDTSIIFSGDTLFLSACGKFFEGTPGQMYEALIGVLSKLPPETKVYCGHEYSLGNLIYAHFADPENPHVVSKLKWAKQQREKSLPTIPSTIGEELQYNPFMRVDEPSIQRRCGTSNGIETMAFLRNEKDNFKA